jgi:hypothetical protein
VCVRVRRGGGGSGCRYGIHHCHADLRVPKQQATAEPDPKQRVWQVLGRGVAEAVPVLSAPGGHGHHRTTTTSFGSSGVSDGTSARRAPPSSMAAARGEAAFAWSTCELLHFKVVVTFVTTDAAAWIVRTFGFDSSTVQLSFAEQGAELFLAGVPAVCALDAFVTKRDVGRQTAGASTRVGRVMAAHASGDQDGQLTLFFASPDGAAAHGVITVRDASPCWVARSGSRRRCLAEAESVFVPTTLQANGDRIAARAARRLRADAWLTAARAAHEAEERSRARLRAQRAGAPRLLAQPAGGAPNP